MNREWLTSPYGFVIFICLGYLANTTALAIADAWTFIRWLKHRRSRPDPAARTPAAKIQRQSLRPVHLPQGPAMPDEIRRTGTPKYGPPRTRPDRRGLVAGAVVLAVLLVAGIAAGAWYLGHRSASTPKPQAAAATATSAPPVHLDSYARRACQLLDKAVQERSQGDRMSSFNAGLDEFDATTAAAGSSLPELTAITKQSGPNDENYKAVTAMLRDWCTAHWSPGQ